MKGRGKASRGGIEVYAGSGSKVIKQARAAGNTGIVRKRGGKAMKAPIMLEGAAPKHHRLDRPGRKSGGAVGADSAPMSQASRLSGDMKKGGKC